LISKWQERGEVEDIVVIDNLVGPRKKGD